MSHGSFRRTAADTASSAFFSGSYRLEDVKILLKPISVEPIGIAEKERLIQSGRRHYSEMLSPENLPSPRYMEIFREAFAVNRRRMALDLLHLAAIIGARRSGEITLVSLARAGTPIGVALKHILQRFFGREAAHYSISIIRDRGLDANALRFILGDEARSETGIVFVDGWTGKGVIARELDKCVRDFNSIHRTRLDSGLFVLTDLAGVGIAPTDDDYLIPSSILNATISGLISRSVLNRRIGPGDFHGCVYYREFEPHDLSAWFIEEILKEACEWLEEGCAPSPMPVDPARARSRSQRLLEEMTAGFGIADENLIKPGIGEATRVLLRRVPERVIVRDGQDPAVAHLLQLAREKGVVWTTETALPYRAVSLIKGISDA
ncbi:cysteine protease StiP family protein [Methylocaldum sp. MU1018]